MKNIAAQMVNFDREQMRRIANNMPEQYDEKPQVQQVAQIINGVFSQLLATFPASLANRDQNELNEIRRQWVLAFRENGITSMEQVNAGMRVARRQNRPFLPSPGQFVAWCREEASVIAGLPNVSELVDMVYEYCRKRGLYGGAVGFIMIEGQAPMTPLRLETIGEGKFKGILPLDRWMINPVLTRRIKEMGPDLGKPEFYDVVTTATGIPAWRIHHSRLIRFDGVTLPFQQKMTENEWGMSVVERIWDRLTAFDSATVGAAQLVYKAHLRTYSVEKLRELIALGGPAYEALLKNIDLIRQFQSNEGMTLMDSRDKFETHQYSFSGLDDILSQFAEQISGAVGIPLVRLFGQSPKGFSTGDADLANYYDRISSLQERRLRLPVRRILDIMHRSELGKPLPDDFTFEFNPLWQMSDVDRSTVALNTTNAISTALGDGLMTLKAAMTDLRENSDVTGIGASITDEDIENAEDEAPPGIGELGDNPPESPGGDPISNEPTADSAGGRGYRKWALRWFKR